MQERGTFTDIALDQLLDTATKLNEDGWRAVQVLCNATDNGVDITYSFAKDDELANYQLRGVRKGVKVPSLQGLFLGMFPFENEAKDLFGVDIEGMTLDFAGEFYQTSMTEPMTILTPEAKARKDKAAKAAAKAAEKAEAQGKSAKAPKENPQAHVSLDDFKNPSWWPAVPAGASSQQPAEQGDAVKDTQASAPQAMTDEEIEEKVAGLPPEKAEKLRAALKAKQQAAREGGEA